MSYSKYYTDGWADGESGGTPVTAEALNHMEDGIVDASSTLALSTLTITRIDNSYCDATAIGRLNAYKKSGMLFLNGNLGLTTAIPDSTSDISIATVSGWSACSYVYLTVPARNGSGTIGLFITSSGEIKIHNYSGSAVSGWARFSICVPSTD